MKPVNPWVTTFVVMLGMIMGIVDASIVNVAVPHRMGTLGASVGEISWVVTAYTLANVIVIPLSAWMSSLVGRSRLYLLAIVVFTVASMLCGLAPGLGLLIFARVIHGAAAGVMMPTAQSILYESFPPEQRGTSMAVFGLGIMVGPAVGPTLGGFITDNYGWQWIFYINLPLGVLSAILVPIFLRDPDYLRRRTSARGDLIGVALLAGGIGLLQYVLEKGEDAGWFDADWIVMSVALAVLLMVAFVIWELEHPDPAVELRVFKDRTFAAACGVNVAVGVGLMGGMFMLPLFLQQLLGFSATQSGLLLPQILRGFGMAFCFVPLSVTSMARIPNHRMGQATGLYNLTRSLGGSLGIAWLASMLNRFRAQHYVDLTAHVDSLSPVPRMNLSAVLNGLMARGYSAELAQATAWRSLFGRVMRASAELAFRDMFVTIVVLFFASLPLLLLLQRRDASAPGAVTVVHAD